MTQSTPSHIALVGPTASGKSALAMAVAENTGKFELVSVDSMQVYRGMDIGTAKPTVDEQNRVRHHLLDLVDPDQEFTLAEFQRAAQAAIADIESRGKRAILVGGTGLYLQSITDDLTMPGQYPEVRHDLEAVVDTRALHQRLVELDPVAAGRMEPDNRRRILRALEVTVGSGQPFSSFGPGLGAYPETKFRLVALRMDPEENRRRINRRVDDMFTAGLPAEVAGLRDAYVLSKTARQAIGYKEILDRIDAWTTDDETAEVERRLAIDEVKRRTRSFARRQRVWFRRDPRMRFLDISENGTSMDVFDELLAVARD